MTRYKIALYIRLSLEDSKYDSLSIENQRMILNEYAFFPCRKPPTRRFGSSLTTATAEQISSARPYRNCWSWCGQTR